MSAPHFSYEKLKVLRPQVNNCNLWLDGRSDEHPDERRIRCDDCAYPTLRALTRASVGGPSGVPWPSSSSAVYGSGSRGAADRRLLRQWRTARNPWGIAANPSPVTDLQTGVVGVGSVASIATFDTPTGPLWCFDGMGLGSGGITKAELRSALSAPWPSRTELSRATYCCSCTLA